MKSIKSAVGVRRQLARKMLERAVIEGLEPRQLMSTNVLTYHNDTARTGVNSTETTLSPANVKEGAFGKLYTTPLDGNAYAEPLVVSGETINAGVNTVAAPGVYDTVYVETQNDSAYAISTLTGKILWQRSFITTSTGAPGTDINNPNGAALLAAPTSGEVSCTDIVPTYGITGTPVIDLSANRMYVVAFTKEVINGVAHFTQRIHALNLSDGTDQVTPYLIGDTTGTNTNTTGIYVYGSGDGSVTDPYNNTGKSVVQFNSLRENERAALSLVNGTLFVSYASHCDDFPYHGWIVSWNVANLTTQGFVLNGVFCASPNGGGAGIWGGGGALTFDPDNSSIFYFETGNGFGQSGGISVDPATGFPTGGAFFEAAVKMTVDPTTSATHQNLNGWGFKALDYFIPFNQALLDNVDEDLGSGSPLALPDSAGIAGHQHLLIVSGKQGVVYVIDRDNMGGYSTAGDNVLNSVSDGAGHMTPPTSITGVLSTPAFYNNTLYFVSGYSALSRSFTISSSGTLVATSQTAVGSFGYLPGSPVISSNGLQGGIVWQTDRNTNELHAYDANTYNTELWNSAQKPNGGDSVGTINKLSTPTVANGEVFVGTANTLVAYGLTPPVSAVPSPSVLTATALSGTSVNLAWNDPTYGSNVATSYSVEELINGTWTVINTAPGGALSLTVGGLALSTSYSFRIRGLNGLGYSAYSNVAPVTTTSQTEVIDYTAGFGGSVSGLVFNGNADVINGRAELTDLEDNQSGSIFSALPVDVSHFSTAFQFQQSSGASQIADGMTFTIQSQGVNALGARGGGLGYGQDGGNGGPTISNSEAIKFDLYSNGGEGTNSTGLYLNGANPTVPSIDLGPSGVNLHLGDVMQCNLTYDGTTLTETLSDTTTGAVFNTTYTVNLLNYSGAVAYVGFTGGTGGLTANQDILNWKFNPNASAAPAAPSGLGAVPASATSINLAWTSNATSQTAYYLDRATDAGFTTNLITETLPSTPASFTDAAVGLASGGTYYYRIRAINSAGSSVNSNVAMVSIPFAPARATNPVFDSVDETSIDMHWTDNAGTNAIGYHILRSVSGGTYVLYATLPNSPTSTATEYDWTDTGLNPGTFYDYHIQAYNVAGYNDFIGGNAWTLPLPPTGVVATANSSAVLLNWTAATGAVSYNIYRGVVAGGESTAPLATGITTLTFTDKTAVAGTKYFYTVTPVNQNLAPLNNEGDPSTEVSATVPTSTSVKLVGTPIGTPTSWSNYNDTIQQVFDGNFSTFFDAPSSSLTAWVGLDLGYAQTITAIKFAPRAGLEFRSVGGVFQVSSTPDFSSNVVTIATITTTPVANVLTTIPVNPGGAYRYVRYTGGTQWVNIAEMEVDGLPTPPPAYTKLTGVPIGTQTSWSNYNDTILQVFDGNFGTFFDAPNSSLSNWVGLDLGVPQTITQIKFAPRTGLEFRSVGGQFQVSSTADFSSNVFTIGTITTTPVANQLTTMLVNPPGMFRYARYVGGTQWVNISELEIDGVPTATPTYTKFTGTPIGTATSYNNQPNNTVQQVFDGNFTTFFDAPNSSLSNWAGLDLGSPQTISQIKYAPRPGLESRMIGGMFQVSSSSTFAFNVITIATITAAPLANQFTVIPVSPGGAYRYVRYVGGTGWVNIAEMEVDGIPVAPTYTKLTGTAIGTQTSYNNQTNNTIQQVFDGNLSSYFDAPNSSLTNWVGLDLGSAKTISQIQYAPRSGFESRMVGGMFQVSNTADFSSGVVTLYTITTAPVAGVLSSVSVTPGAAYRYIRYTGGTGWVNIAEMEVDM